MTAEGLPTPLNIEDSSHGEFIRPRSPSVIDRQVDQIIPELESSGLAHRLHITDIYRTINLLNAEIRSLSRAGQDMVRYHNRLRLSVRLPLKFEFPSLSIEES